jgi:hypothetical protein
LIVSRRDLGRLCGFLALAVASVTTLSGCAGTCATNCPAIVFNVLATPGENLNLATAQWMGPACPTESPVCIGDAAGNACTRFFLIAMVSGVCELDLTFSDARAPFSVQAQFGPETHQGCCHGLPVIGAATVYIPPLHPVVGPDAGIDRGNGSGGEPDAGGGDLTGVPTGDGSNDPAADHGAGDADSG